MGVGQRGVAALDRHEVAEALSELPGDFGEHETGHITRAGAINSVAEQLVIRRGLDEIVDQGAVVDRDCNLVAG